MLAGLPASTSIVARFLCLYSSTAKLGGKLAQLAALSRRRSRHPLPAQERGIFGVIWLILSNRFREVRIEEGEWVEEEKRRGEVYSPKFQEVKYNKINSQKKIQCGF